MRDSRITKLADVLVNYSIGVKKGQSVRITGRPVCQALVIELYRKVLEAGGHPIIRMAPDETGEIFLKRGAMSN
jgi:aminopeptidase